MPTLKIKQNGVWQDVAAPAPHTHNITDINGIENIAGGDGTDLEARAMAQAAQETADNAVGMAGAAQIAITKTDEKVTTLEENAITIDLSDANAGVAISVNADTLNGKTESNLSVGDSAKLNGQSAGYYTYAHNLLDNSDFTNPVNQRGQTKYTAAGYSIDRWFLSIDTATSSVAVENAGLKLTAAGQYYTFLQRCEHIKVDRVHTFVVCDTDDNLYLINSSANARVEQTVPFGQLIANQSASPCVYAVELTSGKSVTLKWAALYEGEYTAETLPPYRPKGYAAELAECQRYFQRVGSPNGINYAGFGLITSSASKTVRITLPLVAQLAKTGAFTISGTAQIDAATGSAIQNAITTTSGTFYLNGIGAYVDVALTDTPSAGTQMLRLPASTFIDLSADL